MHFTVREEIMILSSIYCLCLFSIPLILIDASTNKEPEDDEGAQKNSSELEFQRKVLIDSLMVLENLNEGSEKGSNGFVFSDLLDLSEEDFQEEHPHVLSSTNNSTKSHGKQTRNAWQKFNFINKTVMRSQSLKLPLAVDWRVNKVITEVKTQQITCGSCFVVGVLETIESMMALKTGKLVNLSIQQMLDCNEYEMGCEGGDPCRLLQWLYLSQTEIQLKVNYPSLKDNSQQQSCDVNNMKLNNSGVNVKDYLCDDFINKEELMLLYLAYQGPLIAAINALPLEFYDNHIVKQNCDPENLNHVVQIVGYDMTGDVPFYIVKNSWGPNFGTSGYMRIAIGGNMCGIAQKVSAVVV